MANNIRERRLARGLTMRDLADRMGTHYTTIAKIERSERRLTPDWVARFASALGIDPSDISTNGSTLPAGGAKPIPVIGLVAAGNWREAVQSADEYVPAPSAGPNTFGLTVEGDSMNKVAQAGSIVMVDPDQAELHDGAYYVVMNAENDTTFKQYRANPARLEPCSDNPEHRTIPLGRIPFSVVGRVTGFYTPLR
jgi:repressor LexA